MTSVNNDKILYFAYGSNMLQSRLEERVGEVSFETIGYVEDYRFQFNKKSEDGTSKANLDSSKGSYTWGSVFKLTEQQLTELDSYEGVFAKCPHYARKTIPIKTENGSSLDVVAYIAEPNYILKDFIPPSPKYLQLVLQGASEHRISTGPILRAAENLIP